ncbi:cytochrome c-type biogenesis protein [Azohydromonas lata]|uniref:Cytochrome c-type biogenesis protein n=1 Tax=Azohydromonas lata TaxID=45677 RepID=A0ABU5IPY0_9BURK|nr:cytochrome c-type biogenesis protein [Azohydromonas lata]MDZ5460957.1 cytochrome c-type biogenesis protein [Azohydromonas lata]
MRRGKASVLLRVACLLACLSMALAGAAPTLQPQQEARAHHLAQSLRCPVCQNQTVAESNAPLAQDLREQIQAQVAAGRSDEEVRAFMVSRYGDFVLYEPRATAQTWLLWLGPFMLLGGGALVLGARVRRAARAELSADAGRSGEEVA